VKITMWIVLVLSNLIAFASASWQLRASSHEPVGRVGESDAHVSLAEKSQVSLVPIDDTLKERIMQLRGMMLGKQSHRHEHEPQPTEQFLEFEVLGDLTNVRECIVMLPSCVTVLA